jgi:hypothetical protein
MQSNVRQENMSPSNNNMTHYLCTKTDLKAVRQSEFGFREGLRMIMRISNFKMLTGPKHFRQEASVDVTTGFLWWRKTINCEIYNCGDGWLIFGSNQFVPTRKVEAAKNRNYTRSGKLPAVRYTDVW